MRLFLSLRLRRIVLIFQLAHSATKFDIRIEINEECVNLTSPRSLAGEKNDKQPECYPNRHAF